MDTQDVRHAQPRGERTRQPYERPAVNWEEDFEPYAYAGCGKMAGSGGACNTMSSS